MSFGFEISGSKWIGASVDYYVNLIGSSGTGIAWNTAFIQAINDWNTETVFNFNVIPEYKDPCVSDELNSVAFLKDICGLEYNDSAMAVTIVRYERQLLGPPAIVEGDIFVNSNIEYDIYDRDSASPNPFYKKFDFKRSVLHELGHVIGLDHEEVNQAVMQPKYGNIYKLQEDDILGVSRLYGGLSNCTIKPLKLGFTEEALSFPDCTVKELTVGGNDESLVDIFSFSLSHSASYNFSVLSKQLESVIIVSDNDLNYLARDSDTSGGCDANLQTVLGPGEYFLIVNTFDSPIKEGCGLVGDYKMSVSYSGPSSQKLGQNLSITGARHDAKFSGAITGNDGLSFGNKFTPNDSLDISATISIDPVHRGRPGFIVVAARIDNQFLLLNDQGSFIDSKALIPFLEKNLETIEAVQIYTNLVAAEFDISQIEVDFFVGYGLLAEPNEVFFHEKPINLIISPSEE
jgi:hypothetical protein